MKNDQQKLYTVFQLIRLLSAPPAKDVSQLTRQLGLKKSTVYEYVNLLKRVGYIVETDVQHRKYIDFQAGNNKAGVLSVDELSHLQEILQQMGVQSALSQTIIHKLELNLSLVPLADALPQLHTSRIIQLIRSGINIKHRLILRRYRSLTSNTVEDRHIAPLEITQDYRYLIAWDINKQGQRQFKINRIEDVDLLDEPIIIKHVPSPMDIFGLTGDDWLSVRLQLSSTAQHLLIEEFPLSRPYIRTINQQTIFDGMVRNWKGVGRFVLGLPGEIKVLQPQAFIDYLEKRKG